MRDILTRALRPKRIYLCIVLALLSISTLVASSPAVGAPTQEPAPSPTAQEPIDEFVLDLEDIVGDHAQRYGQNQDSTVAGIYCGGELIGSARSRRPHHAEELLAEKLTQALDDPRCRNGADLVINRSPCTVERCGTVLVQAAQRFVGANVPFRVVVTGLVHSGHANRRPRGEQALSLQDLWTAVDWINRMMNRGAQVVVGQRSGDTSPRGQELIEVLRYVVEARGLLDAGEAARSTGAFPAALAASASGATGGIDFSSLELRYLGESNEGDGLQYAFSADAAAAEGGPQADVGLQVAELQSDAFFTWLSLPTSAFWVNLNPDEPDRIVDEELGRTDVGRILLEADLQMKRTVGQLTHPDNPLGAEFWNQLDSGGGEATCLSFRQWIVPGEAVVHEDDDGLYIVDAPLEVQLETDYFGEQGVANDPACLAQDPAVEEHNETTFRSLILPEVQRAVNEAPEYADLRRAYLSRVAAEWYRQRSLQEATTYGDLVDSGDIDRWASEQPWSSQDVFDQYVQSYTEGEYNVTRETQQGDWIVTNTYVYGGVDFATVLFDELAASELQATRPDLPEVVDESFSEPTTDAAQGDIWLGAATTPSPLPGTSGSDTELGAPAQPDRPRDPRGPGGPVGDSDGLPLGPLAVPLAVVVTVVMAWLLVRPSTVTGRHLRRWGASGAGDGHRIANRPGDAMRTAGGRPDGGSHGGETDG